MAYFRKLSGLHHLTFSELALYSNPVNKNSVGEEKSRKSFINVRNLIFAQNIALNIFSNTDDV